MIQYSIQPSHPEAHLFAVTLTIAKPDPTGQNLRLPAWIPGSYMVRDFAKNVVQLHARSGDAPVAVEREDKSTWRCAPCDGELVVEYEVYAWDLSVRSAHLDTTHGFFNGTSVFLEVVGQADQACDVELLRPEGEPYETWRVATAMTQAGAERYGFGRYRAANYDELIDHPVEMGDFTLATFEAYGVPHDVVLTGRHQTDMERLCRDLKVICEHHIDFFGQPAPVERYVFMTMVTGDGYGGLEHRASTALMCSRKSLPLCGDEGVNNDYREYLGLCSHEYFHTWNVKRIRPAAFAPFDLSQEQHTRLLWAFEGITSYYDDLSLVRCGLIKPESYLELLAKTISRVWRGAGRHKQSVTDSSFDAWTKFYKQDENAPNAIVSYYTKGALVALCLDVFIREHSQDQKSLDDLMRLLWQRFGLDADGLQQGVPESAIESAVEELLEPQYGVRARTFFNHALRSTNELNVAEALAYLGVELHFTAPKDQNDWGGYSAKVPTTAYPHSSLGVRVAPSNGFAKITHVYDGGAAQLAGLAAGDLLLAVDGLQVKGATLERQLAAYAPDTSVELTAFRRDELMSFKATLQAAQANTARLVWPAEPEVAVAERRQQWLQQADS